MTTDQLKVLNQDGTPPESRIGNASSLYQIWNTLRLADAVSSYNRALIDGAYDGARPLNESSLITNGQSYRFNVSWGWAKSVLDMAVSGYVDIMNATETLFECPTEYGDPSERLQLERIVAKEVSECIRSWKDFFPTYLRLITAFIKHGVSISYFMDEYDWRFISTDLSDFKIERDIKIGQENISIACCLRFYSPTDLYQQIKDPERAEQNGWNVQACRQAIMQCASQGQQFGRYSPYDWEKWEVLIKNNDLYWTAGTAQPQRIRVVHAWVQEYNGKVSHFMINDSDQISEFLYKKIDRFENVYEAYTVFTFGVGTNGYYSGIRGQGYDVAPIHTTLDRAYCAAFELAIFGSAPIFQPKDQSALQEMQYTPQGPYSLLTPGINVQTPAVTNLSAGIFPMMQAFSQMLRDRTGNANTQQLIDSRTEKTKFQVQAELGSIAKMSVSALNLFYDPWQTLMREMVRRMIYGCKMDFGPQDPGGKYLVGLKKRLLQSGGQAALQAFYNLDVDRLSVVKAIGAGSEAARLMIYDQLTPFINSLDDAGREAFIFDIFADRLGHRNASRYKQPPGSEMRTTLAEELAQIENNQLIQTMPVEVLPSQNHIVHAKVHLARLMPMAAQASDALTVDPMSVAGILPGLNNLAEHTSIHVERVSQDRMYQEESAMFRQQLQQVGEVLHNGILKVQKLQEQAMQQQAMQGPQEPSQPSPEQIAKIEGERAMREMRMSMDQLKFEQETNNRAIDAAQKRAIADADAASKMARNLPGLTR